MRQEEQDGNMRERRGRSNALVSMLGACLAESWSCFTCPQEINTVYQDVGNMV